MGSKRQLPPWMLRAQSTDEVKNSDSEAKNQEKCLKQLSTAPKSESEKKTESCLVKKCKTTRARRKLVKQDEVDVSNNTHEEDGLDKENSRRKRKAKDSKGARSNVADESTLGDNELGEQKAEDDVSYNVHEDDVVEEHYPPSTRNKRKAKDLKATGSNVAEECNLSEDELSVDDLISIAKEYVNADTREEGRRSPLAECESVPLPQPISCGDSTTPKDITLSSATALEAVSSECQTSERGDDVPTSSGTRDDVVQDVMELLLGPLFKRRNKAKPNPEQ